MNIITQGLVTTKNKKQITLRINKQLQTINGKATRHVSFAHNIGIA